MGLPTDDDGHIVTSAEFGESVIVEITYNTEADGRPVEASDPGDDYPRTLHGPFADMAEAQVWMDAYPDDTDVADMVAIPINNVRPQED